MPPSLAHVPEVRFPHGTTISDVAYLEGDRCATVLETLDYAEISVSAEQKRRIMTVCEQYFNRTVKLLQRAFQNVVEFPEREVMSYLQGAIAAKLQENPSRAVVILDRAIHHAMRQIFDHDPNLSKRVEYLSITRKTGSLFTASPEGKVARVGDEPLEQQLQRLSQNLRGYEVAIVDDTFVEGGTSRAARRMLRQSGVQLAGEDKDLFFFRAVRRPNEQWVDAPSAVLATNSLASMEHRECLSIGGTLDKAGRANKVGLEVGPMAPFDPEAKALRLNGRLDTNDLSAEMLQIEIDFWAALETVLKNSLEKTDGEITLYHLRRNVPVDAADENGVRPLVKEYMVKHVLQPDKRAVAFNKTNSPMQDDVRLNDPIFEAKNNHLPEHNEHQTKQKQWIERHHATTAEAEKVALFVKHFPTFLRSTGIRPYLQHMVQKLNEQERPAKDVVCTDMDGVIADLRYVESHDGLKRFGNSYLGRSVHKHAIELCRELEGFQSEAEAAEMIAKMNTETGLPQYFIGKHGQELVRTFGPATVQRIKQIFADCYPRAIAAEKADAFIASMPMAYHAFRHKTWDHDMREVYEPNTQAKEFAQDIVRRKGQLVFVTAAPRIHALKMLKYTGIITAIGHDKFELHSMEEMYKPGTVQDGTYVEDDKGQMLKRIAEMRGIGLDKLAMAGDQYKSDVHHPVQAGVQSALITGPVELARYGRMFRLPKDRGE